MKLWRTAGALLRIKIEQKKFRLMLNAPAKLIEIQLMTELMTWLAFAPFELREFRLFDKNRFEILRQFADRATVAPLK